MEKIIRRLLKKSVWVVIKESFLEFIAYFSSIVTISIAYYNRFGAFIFSIKNWIDWLILGVIGLILFSGIHTIIRKNNVPNSVKAYKKDLPTINQYFWATAAESITIIGGDVSWLKKDVDSLIQIAQKNKITIEIFCDYDRLPNNRIFVEEMVKNGVLIKPYPDGVLFKTRCLVIDINDSSNCKIIYFNKLDIAKFNNTQYEVVIHSDKKNSEVMILLYLLNLISKKTKQFVLVGITGINNVGKTSLVTEIKAIKKHTLTTNYIDDAFRVNGGRTRLDDNINALIMQISSILNNTSEILIMDRTPADTLAYIKLFDENLYESLSFDVAKLMKKFDLLINLSIKNEDFRKRTKLLNQHDRKRVHNYLNDFYIRNGIKTEIYENTKKIDYSIQNMNAHKITNTINEIYQIKSIENKI